MPAASLRQILDTSGQVVDPLRNSQLGAYLTGINTASNFPVNRGKQFVPVTPAGNVIGDGILFHEEAG